MFWRYQRHHIDVSIYVDNLKALQCVNSKILNASMTLMVTNKLDPSRFAKNDLIGNRN